MPFQRFNLFDAREMKIKNFDCTVVDFQDIILRTENFK